MKNLSLHIQADTLHQFAYVNQEFLQGTPRGILLNFHGMGHAHLVECGTSFDERVGRQGIISVMPYGGPWTWINFGLVNYTDEIIRVLKEKYALPPERPLVLTGASMGGLNALGYAQYGAHKATACALNCPVCDLAYHAVERVDVARTMHASYGQYTCGLERAMALHSPVRQVRFLPDIPYYFVHGDADSMVNKQAHSDRLTTLLKALKATVVYREIQGMKHTDLAAFPEEERLYEEFIIHQFMNAGENKRA